MAKQITTHHDGHGLTESIKVEAVDEIGPGGAHHRYEFSVDKGGVLLRAGYLQFQEGARDEPGSTPGVLAVAVLAVLIDQLEEFQAGPYPSGYGQEALDYLVSAADSLRKRADERASRGVLGRNAV